MTYFENKEEHLPANTQEQLAIIFEYGSFLLRDMKQKHAENQHVEWVKSFNKVSDVFFKLSLIMCEPEWVSYFNSLNRILYQIASQVDYGKIEILENNFKDMAKCWRKSLKE